MWPGEALYSVQGHFCVASLSCLVSQGIETNSGWFSAKNSLVNAKCETVTLKHWSENNERKKDCVSKVCTWSTHCIIISINIMLCLLVAVEIFL